MNPELRRFSFSKQLFFFRRILFREHPAFQKDDQREENQRCGNQEELVFQAETVAAHAHDPGEKSAAGNPHRRKIDVQHC